MYVSNDIVVSQNNVVIQEIRNQAMAEGQAERQRMRASKTQDQCYKLSLKIQDLQAGSWGTSDIFRCYRNISFCSKISEDMTKTKHFWVFSFMMCPVLVDSNICENG